MKFVVLLFLILVFLICPSMAYVYENKTVAFNSTIVADATNVSHFGVSPCDSNYVKVYFSQYLEPSYNTNVNPNYNANFTEVRSYQMTIAVSNKYTLTWNYKTFVFVPHNSTGWDYRYATYYYQGNPVPPFNATPTADFECNNDWRGDAAPFSLTCINNGENTETGNTTWQVISPSKGSYVEIDEHDLEDQILNTPGRWSVNLTNCNPLGCAYEYKEDYVLVLGADITPDVTPTIYPNVTLMPLIPTLSPTLAIIINRTDYRSTIEETLIGNITAPYLDFVDDWTESWIDWIDNFSTQINWPLIRLTEILEDVLESVTDAFDDQYEKAQVFLYWTGLMLAVIPPTVWALINYKMLIEVLKAFMET